MKKDSASYHSCFLLEIKQNREVLLFKDCLFRDDRLTDRKMNVSIKLWINILIN